MIVMVMARQLEKTTAVRETTIFLHFPVVCGKQKHDLFLTLIMF